MRVICHLFLVKKLRVYGAVPPFYRSLYCLVLYQTETLWNERQYNVDGQCCPATGGADKFLARPVRIQATATEDFDFHTSYL